MTVYFVKRFSVCCAQYLGMALALTGVFFYAISNKEKSARYLELHSKWLQCTLKAPLTAE